MSTRSRISIINKNGSIKGIYCHNDGYLEGVGAILLEHYTNTTKVRQLVELGDISSLNEKVCTPPKEHSYDNRVPGYVVAYGRDRGEMDVPARNDANLGKYLENGDSDIEFHYFWDTAEKRWFYYEYNYIPSTGLTLLPVA